MNALEVKAFKMIAALSVGFVMCGLSSCYIDELHRKQIKNLQNHVAEIEKGMDQMAQAMVSGESKELKKFGVFY